MIECKFCKVKFKANAPNQKYCTNKCKRQVRTNCHNCGDEIIRYKRKDGVYHCSMKCASTTNGRRIEIDCKKCGVTFGFKVSAVEKYNRQYCSNDCANKAMKKRITLRCENCGDDFEVRPHEKNRKYCTKDCSNEGYRTPIEKDLLVRMYSEQELTSREIGWSISRSKKVVLDYLHYYDIPVRPSGLMNREKIECNDGHLVRSYYERAFDNYLYKEGIEHEHDPRLPFDKRYMADFKVEHVYVEIWGMMSWKKYRERRKRKLKLYEENDCVLLEIFPEDFKDLGVKMNELKRLIK